MWYSPRCLLAHQVRRGITLIIIALSGIPASVFLSKEYAKLPNRIAVEYDENLSHFVVTIISMATVIIAGGALEHA